MIITSTIIFLCTLSFFVPRNRLHFFFVISAVLFSALYFWFSPPIDYDLYRHYLSFESMKNVSFQDLFDNFVQNRYKTNFAMDCGSDYIYSSIRNDLADRI